MNRGGELYSVDGKMEEESIFVPVHCNRQSSLFSMAVSSAATGKKLDYSAYRY